MARRAGDLFLTDDETPIIKVGFPAGTARTESDGR
jgi:hypothetical protein